MLLQGTWMHLLHLVITHWWLTVKTIATVTCHCQNHRNWQTISDQQRSVKRPCQWGSVLVYFPVILGKKWPFIKPVKSDNSSFNAPCTLKCFLAHSREKEMKCWNFGELTSMCHSCESRAETNNRIFGRFVHYPTIRISCTCTCTTWQIFQCLWSSSTTRTPFISERE